MFKEISVNWLAYNWAKEQRDLIYHLWQRILSLQKHFRKDTKQTTTTHSEKQLIPGNRENLSYKMSSFQQQIKMHAKKQGRMVQIGG